MLSQPKWSKFDCELSTEHTVVCQIGLNYVHCACCLKYVYDMYIIHVYKRGRLFSLEYYQITIQSLMKLFVIFQVLANCNGLCVII